MEPKVLTIAGFDGSGGAGLQADLKTFAALGCYGLSVLTALPIQNTQGVRGCYELPLSSISDQLECLIEDMTPQAIKIGMLFTAPIIHTVADFLEHYAKSIPMVLDPVMVATSGHRLIQEDAQEALVTRLFPLARVITPNLAEAQALTHSDVSTPDQMPHIAQALVDLGCQAVYLKGGHLPAPFEACDLLLEQKQEPVWLSHPRITTPNTHGTGCTLSSAIAAGLAQGLDLATSCRQAKDYLQQAILFAKDQWLGLGHGPVAHFWGMREPLAVIARSIATKQSPVFRKIATLHSA
jgi:hydroxymethylpyrimidine/phosphomethylpyrimidine kinase